MKNVVKSSLVVFSIGLIWHVLARTHFVDQEFFPSPFDVAVKLSQLIIHGELTTDILASAMRLLLGTLISVPVSLIIAVLCVHSKIIGNIFRPIIAFTYPLPKVAIIPLLMLIFGIGDSSKVAVISLGMFYLIFVNLYTSMMKLKSSTLNAVTKIYKIEKKDYLFQFLIKGSLLDFLVGLKLALGYGLTLVVVSEFSMSRNGVGNFIWKTWDQFKILDMYAGIFFLCLIGFFVYGLLDYLITRTTKYYTS